MTVKLNTRYAGPDGNYPAGAVVDFPDAVARGLVSGGYAVEVAGKKAPEKAEQPKAKESAAYEPPENTMQSSSRRRRKPKDE